MLRQAALVLRCMREVALRIRFRNFITMSFSQSTQSKRLSRTQRFPVKPIKAGSEKVSTVHEPNLVIAPKFFSMKGFASIWLDFRRDSRIERWRELKWHEWFEQENVQKRDNGTRTHRSFACKAKRR